jgi:hypothetical protein
MSNTSLRAMERLKEVFVSVCVFWGYVIVWGSTVIDQFWFLVGAFVEEVVNRESYPSL